MLKSIKKECSHDFDGGMCLYCGKRSDCNLCNNDEWQVHCDECSQRVCDDCYELCDKCNYHICCLCRDYHLCDE